MKSPSKKLLTALALMMAALCASSSVARKQSDSTNQNKRFIRVSDVFKPIGFEGQLRGGELIGMTVVRKDGTRKALKEQSKPVCATSCPAGQRLKCWEDEEQMMSMCVCVGSGGTVGEYLTINGMG